MPNSHQHTVALITDSTCDIPPDLVATYGITIIPQIVVWGEMQYLDRVTLDPEDFYERLDTDPVYPSSSCPTPAAFLERYEAARQGGAEAIVMATVSSAMSGTHNAARQAGELINLPVTVIDSKGPTMSLGWQVLAAACAREAAENSGVADPAAIADQMVGAAAAARSTMAQLVCMDAIKYLQKGGRIGNAVGLVGTALKIRPVIYIDHETGLVNVERAARTRKRGIEALVKGFYRRLDLSRPVHVAVLHGNDPASAATLADRVRREIDPVELLINITGPVLGINTGPNALALAGYTA